MAIRAAVSLSACLLFSACSDGNGSGAGSEGGAGGEAPGGFGGAGSGGAAPTARVAPFDVVDYPDGSGKLFRVPISVNGSEPFFVLLDTGSDGLRVFASALGDTSVETTDEAISVEFGLGNRMNGHVANAEVAFGDVATAGPIAFHLVEELACAPSEPGCDFADGDAPFFDGVEVRGILGVSTRRGQPASVFTPFAQLAPDLSTGFLLRSGGFDAPSGEIVFGPSEAEQSGLAFVELSPDDSQPNGVPAWRDDAVEACFRVNGAALDPECTEAVFDTGGSVDVIYAPSLPAELNDDGVLAAGATLETSVEGALTMSLTVASPPVASVDLVFIDDTEPFALMGIGAYLRNDVMVDSAQGRLGFRARP